LLYVNFHRCLVRDARTVSSQALLLGIWGRILNFAYAKIKDLTISV